MISFNFLVLNSNSFSSFQYNRISLTDFQRKLRHANTMYPKYSIRDNRLVSFLHEKDPFDAKDFSGIKRTRREKYGRVLCAERVTGGLSNLSHFENAIMLAYWSDRTQFFTFPLRITLNFPSRSTSTASRR